MFFDANVANLMQVRPLFSQPAACTLDPRFRMREPLRLFLMLVLVPLALSANRAGVASDEPSSRAAAEDQTTVDFSAAIRPILARHCVGCHGPDKQKGGLRLDSRGLAFKGGDGGPAITPGKSSESELLERLVSADPAVRMPFEKPPLSGAEIDLIRRWIDQGATWQESESERRGSSQWSFQPIRDPAPPAVRHSDWVRDPIDRFVLAGLEARKVAPSRAADKATFFRRLALDLTGLLPRADELESFLADSSSNAYEKAVDRLLASPAFGERWAGHWLDLARYADSDGFEQDDPRPFAYRWRDWVIRAINSDLPFDQFTVDQIAGDLVPNATVDQILATGFHRNTPTDREGGIDKEDARRREIVDRVNTVGTVWLGLTIGCAECHSHKFDPISANEYYGFYGFFNNVTDDLERPTQATLADNDRHALVVKAYEGRLVKLTEQFEKATPEQQVRLKSVIDRVKKKGPPELKPEVAVLGPAKKPRLTHVHKGGNYKNQGPLVEPATPAVLPRLVPRNPGLGPPDRLDLAYWIVDPKHPLTARVEANRIWQNLFGAGLVATPDDFARKESGRACLIFSITLRAGS